MVMPSRIFDFRLVGVVTMFASCWQKRLAHLLPPSPQDMQYGNDQACSMPPVMTCTGPQKLFICSVQRSSLQDTACAVLAEATWKVPPVRADSWRRKRSPGPPRCSSAKKPTVWMTGTRSPCISLFLSFCKRATTLSTHILLRSLRRAHGAC